MMAYCCAAHVRGLPRPAHKGEDRGDHDSQRSGGGKVGVERGFELMSDDRAWTRPLDRVHYTRSVPDGLLGGTDRWEELTACNEQACRAVCVVIVSTSRHTGEKCVSAVPRRGRWSGSLSGIKLSSDFSIALFSLCSLSPACTRAVTSDTTRRSLDSDAHATSDFIRDIDALLMY